MNDNDLSMRPFWARAFRGSSPESLYDALAVLAGLLDDPSAFVNCSKAVRARMFAGTDIRMPVRDILSEVAEKNAVSVPDLKNRSRKQIYAWARQEAYYRLKTETTLSYPHIGRIMGGRDHTTVMYGARKYQERMNAASPEPKILAPGRTPSGLESLVGRSISPA